MRAGDIRITRAAGADLNDLLSLLSAVELPHEGVAEHITGFFVARNRENRIIGCAGLERYGRLGLLRSVAVSPETQGSGLGSRLVATLLEDAAKCGIEEVVLLTTTARDYFARRFGFIEAIRADYDGRLADSPEWRLPRCSSAAFLRLVLKRETEQ
jgi:N-acetylglutamate synthase-like GNAT family acetyltransferase